MSLNNSCLCSNIDLQGMVKLKGELASWGLVEPKLAGRSPEMRWEGVRVEKEPRVPLWVIPVHQPQASCILRWTWTGDSFLIWYYTCFSAILQNHIFSYSEDGAFYRWLKCWGCNPGSGGSVEKVFGDKRPRYWLDHKHELTQSSMMVLRVGRSRGKITLVGQKMTAIKMGMVVYLNGKSKSLQRKE